MFTEKEIQKADGYTGILYIDEIPKLSKREAKKFPPLQVSQ